MPRSTGTSTKHASGSTARTQRPPPNRRVDDDDEIEDRATQRLGRDKDASSKRHVRENEEEDDVDGDEEDEADQAVLREIVRLSFLLACNGFAQTR